MTREWYILCYLWTCKRQLLSSSCYVTVSACIGILDQAAWNLRSIWGHGVYFIIISFFYVLLGYSFLSDLCSVCLNFLWNLCVARKLGRKSLGRYSDTSSPFTRSLRSVSASPSPSLPLVSAGSSTTPHHRRCLLPPPKQTISALFACLKNGLFGFFFQLEQCFSLTTIQPEQCFSASFRPANGALSRHLVAPYCPPGLV